jgi:hypothetical protein
MKHHKFRMTREGWKSLGVIAVIWIIILAIIALMVWFLKNHIKIGG